MKNKNTCSASDEPVTLHQSIRDYVAFLRASSRNFHITTDPTAQEAIPTANIDNFLANDQGKSVCLFHMTPSIMMAYPTKHLPTVIHFALPVSKFHAASTLEPFIKSYFEISEYYCVHPSMLGLHYVDAEKSEVHGFYAGPDIEELRQMKILVDGRTTVRED